jgi:hypothetical protein
MRQANRRQHRSLSAMLSLIIVTLLCGVPIGFAAESAAPSSSQPEPSSQPTEAGDIQERGLRNARPGPAPGAAKTLPPPSQPGGDLPPSLCHPMTRMLTQCKCFNQTDCQTLSALFPGPCPVGSQHCEFVPMSRGTMPPLPPNLCGYQVPFTVTECSCHNQAECQLLSPFCPGSCPVGSQSCECTPLQRR